MRLVSFKSSGVVRIGAVVGDTVVHLNALLPGAERIPDDMTAFRKAGNVPYDELVGRLSF